VNREGKTVSLLRKYLENSEKKVDAEEGMNSEISTLKLLDDVINKDLLNQYMAIRKSSISLAAQ